MSPRPGQPPPGPQPLPGVETIIAVGSGKGGVGKTTLAVNLALAMAKLGHKVGLLDADVYGPNVPLMLGLNTQPKVLADNRIEPIDANGLKVISVGLLNPGDKPLIWRGPMLHSIIKQLQDARKAIEMFRQMKVDIVGMVENMSYFVCPHCNHEIDIFSRGGAEKTAKRFEVAFLGNIQLDPDIRKSGDSGTPTVLEGEDSPHAKSLYEFARNVIARVDEIKSSAGESVIQIQ
jgi:ATP-binding protein involved in chromosome partitioning